MLRRVEPAGFSLREPGANGFSRSEFRGQERSYFTGGNGTPTLNQHGTG